MPLTSDVVPGAKFVRLKVQAVLPGPGKKRVRCKCKCGSVVTVTAYSVASGNTKSCGCLRSDTKNLLTHGHTGTLTHTRWIQMRRRCKNEYRGRVFVCERWERFENFLADMGECPAANMGVDRKDGTKGYEPGNCRWATAKQQANNKSNNRRIILDDGREVTVGEWCDENGVANLTKRRTAYYRLSRGYTPEQAVEDRDLRK